MKEGPNWDGLGRWRRGAPATTATTPGSQALQATSRANDRSAPSSDDATRRRPQASPTGQPPNSTSSLLQEAFPGLENPQEWALSDAFEASKVALPQGDDPDLIDYSDGEHGSPSREDERRLFGENYGASPEPEQDPTQQRSSAAPQGPGQDTSTQLRPSVVPQGPGQGTSTQPRPSAAPQGPGQEPLGDHDGDHVMAQGVANAKGESTETEQRRDDHGRDGAASEVNMTDVPSDGEESGVDDQGDATKSRKRGNRKRKRKRNPNAYHCGRCHAWHNSPCVMCDTCGKHHPGECRKCPVCRNYVEEGACDCPSPPPPPCKDCGRRHEGECKACRVHGFMHKDGKQCPPDTSQHAASPSRQGRPGTMGPPPASRGPPPRRGRPQAQRQQSQRSQSQRSQSERPRPTDRRRSPSRQRGQSSRRPQASRGRQRSPSPEHRIRGAYERQTSRARTPPRAPRSEQRQASGQSSQSQGSSNQFQGLTQDGVHALVDFMNAAGRARNEQEREQSPPAKRRKM